MLLRLAKGFFALMAVMFGGLVLAFVALVLMLAASDSRAELTCADLASIAQAAALARMRGETEQSLADRVPDLVAHLLEDGESASARDLEAARQLAITVYRQPITPRMAVRRTLQQCGAQQT